MEFTLNDGVNANNGANGQPGSVPSVWSATKSDQTFVEVSTKNAFYKRRPSRRKLEFILIGLVIIAIILIAVLVFMSVKYYKVNKELKSICRTPDCIHSASSLLRSMNPSVNPCEDFYSFACGKFNDEHPIPQTSYTTDWFAEKSELALAKVQEYLERNNSETEPIPTQQARVMYDACIDVAKLDEIGLDPLATALESMRLSLVPPMDEDDYDETTSISSLLALVKLAMAKDIILHSGVYADVYNRTRNKLTVVAPEEETLLPSHTFFKNNKLYSVEAKAVESLTRGDIHIANSWQHYLYKVIEYFMLKSNVTDIPKKKVKKVAATMLLMSAEVQLVAKNENITKGNLENPNKLFLSQLQKITDDAAESVNLTSKLNWSDYFETLFSQTNETVDIENQEMAVYSLEYYKAISKLLANYSEYQIMLGIWFDVVFALIPYTNEELRTMRSTFLTEAIGQPSPSPRESHCSSSIWTLMSVAIAGGVAEDVQINAMRSDVLQMIDYIQISFVDYVNEAKWIDRETKMAILDKAKYVRRNVGFPDWILNTTLVEGYYEGLEVSDETHLENFLNVVQIAVSTMLITLDSENDYENSDFDPREVNALYIPQENSISIPLGILQFPFYNLGLDALNYGAIGTIIGHELTHAFDTTGRKYDKYGNVNEWWTNRTVDNYNERVSCFIDMYDEFYVPDAGDYVNGNQTLSENLADNGGMKDAYNGYKKMVADNKKPELKLPGLEKYNNDQLFFLGFAHQWCENWSPKSMKYSLEDQHSPNYIRVLGSVSNSEEFSKTWKCSAKTKMNRANKCTLW